MATIFIGGEKFIAQDFIDKTGIENMEIGQIGTPINILPNNKRLCQISSVFVSIYNFNFEESNSYEEWNRQSESVIQYLVENKERFEKMEHIKNIEYANITLAYSLNAKKFAQSIFLPQRLIDLCGVLKLTIEVTLFDNKRE